MATNYTYLLIDDNIIDQIVTSQLLKKVLGVEEINIMNNGHQGIQWIKSRTDKAQPLIILLDMRMPEMGGFEFLSQFETLDSLSKKYTKIFMLSSTLDTEEIRRVEDNQYVTRFLTKPFPIHEFVKMIA